MTPLNRIVSLLTIILSSANLIALETDCKSNIIYGESTDNYLKFKIGSESRKFFFKSVDVYENSGGGITLYLPPFGFNTYSQNLTSQQKSSPYHNEIEDLSKVYFAWYPEESFASDQFDFIEGDLLSDDCFFSNNRRELRRLFRTSTSDIKVDTTTINGNKKIIVTAQSKENESASLKIQVKTKQLKEPLSFDRNELKRLCAEMGIENCSFSSMYYHKNQQFIIIDKQGRKPSYSISSIDNCRFGIPKPGEFKAYELKRLPNQTILIQEFTITTEEDKFKDDPVFNLPLNNRAKSINEYKLISAEATKSYMASTFIELTAPPLLIDSDQMTDVTEPDGKNDENNYRPHYTTMAYEDLPEEQKIGLKKIKPYNFYFTDAEGKLYKTSVQKKGDIIKYSCEEVFFMPTNVTIDYKGRFSSEEAYLAYAEIIIGGDDFIKQGILSNKNSEEHIQFMKQLKKAELDSLISDNKKVMIKNFRAFNDHTTMVEKDYVTYDYLTYHEDVLQLFKAYINAKILKDNNQVGTEASFFETLKPLIDYYQIDTTESNRIQLLNKSKDSLMSHYNKDFIRIVEKGLTKSKLLFSVEQHVDNNSISSLVKSFDSSEGLSLHVSYKDEIVKVKTAEFHKTYQTEMKSCKGIWDVSQLYFNLPFLPIKEGYKTDIFLTNFELFTKSVKAKNEIRHTVPNISATFNKVELKVTGTDKTSILGKEKEAFVVEMTSASKLEGLPGINNQTWSRKDDLMVNGDGKSYAKLYMSTSYPHEIYFIQLKDKKVQFLKESESNNLKDWYLKTRTKE